MTDQRIVANSNLRYVIWWRGTAIKKFCTLLYELLKLSVSLPLYLWIDLNYVSRGKCKLTMRLTILNLLKFITNYTLWTLQCGTNTSRCAQMRALSPLSFQILHLRLLNFWFKCFNNFRLKCFTSRFKSLYVRLFEWSSRRRAVWTTTGSCIGGFSNARIADAK